MKWLINRLVKMRFFQGDPDNYLVRASMVIIYFFLGYSADAPAQTSTRPLRLPIS